jgi:hypothetical protein
MWAPGIVKRKPRSDAAVRWLPKAELDEYQRAGYQLGITAQFVLLCPALLLRNPGPATAISSGMKSPKKKPTAAKLRNWRVAIMRAPAQVRLAETTRQSYLRSLADPPHPLPPQDRVRLNDAGQTEQAWPDPQRPQAA